MEFNKKCAECGKEFVAAQPGWRYCSKSCKLTAQKARMKEKREAEKHTPLVCQRCGKAFLGSERQKYCGNECRRLALGASRRKAGRKELPEPESLPKPVKRPEPTCRLERRVLEAEAAGMSYGRYMAHRAGF